MNDQSKIESLKNRCTQWFYRYHFETQGIKLLILIIYILVLFSMMNGIGTRSLLMDEALFARNLSLFPKGLFISSAAPSAPLFYFSSYVMIRIFGKSEWVLRFLPLLAAGGGFGVFILFIKNHFSWPVTLVNCLLISTSYPFIFYGGNAHPYAIDFFYSVLLLILTVRIIQKFSPGLWALWITVALLSISSSYPSLFIVAGHLILILFFDIVNKKKKNLQQKICGVVIISGLAALLIFLIYVRQAGGMIEYHGRFWSKGFPGQYYPWNIFKWIFLRSCNLLGYLFWNSEGGLIGLFLIVLGMGWLVWNKKVVLFAISIMPFFMTWFASFLHKWSYGPSRTNLFTLPFWVILLGMGFESIWTVAHTRLLKVIIFFSFIIIVIPQIWVLKKPFRPGTDSEEAVRSLYQKISPEIEENDRFLVYYTAEAQFRFYFKDYLESATFQSWTDRRKPIHIKQFITSNLEKSDGRFWLIFSKIHENEDILMIETAQSTCSLLKSYSFPGCKGYLFVCSNNSISPKK